MDRPQNPFNVRAKPETFALFNEIHQKLNAELPHGRITKGEVFDLIVSSASAALAEGRLYPGQKRPENDRTAA